MKSILHIEKSSLSKYNRPLQRSSKFSNFPSLNKWNKIEGNIRVDEKLSKISQDFFEYINDLGMARSWRLIRFPEWNGSWPGRGRNHHSGGWMTNLAGCRARRKIKSLVAQVSTGWKVYTRTAGTFRLGCFHCARGSQSASARGPILNGSS